MGKTTPRPVVWLASALAAALTLGALSAQALAAGGKPATKLVNVADSRALSGLGRWIADTYNSSYWLFAAMVVVTMALMGLLLGLFSDRLVSLLGIDLGKLKHHE